MFSPSGEVGLPIRYAGPTVRFSGASLPLETRLHSTVRLISSTLFRQMRTWQGREVKLVGRFRRVLDFTVGDGAIVALTTMAVGPGPFHIVLDRLPEVTSWPADAHFMLEGDLVRMGPLWLRLGDPPPLWSPRPPWSLRHPRRWALRYLRDLARAEAEHRPSPFAVWLRGGDLPRVQALRQAWGMGKAALRGAVMALAGWGTGLTPSGDDFIAGMMLALWSKYAALTPRAAFLYHVAAPRTTLLSRAFLRAARDGLADAHWQRLLRALAGGAATALRRAAAEAFAFGATSGLDMTAGFLFYWLDLEGGDGPSFAPSGHPESSTSL